MAIIIGLGLVSCKPIFNNEEKSTATQVETSTQTISPTFTKTITPTITVTITKLPTSTHTPTPTLVPGSFYSPYRIGNTVVLDVLPTEYRKDKDRSYREYEVTPLEIKLGEEARVLAKSELGWPDYQEPIEGQEYLAIYVKYLVTSEQDEFAVMSIYPCWDFFLRYEDGGSEIECVDIIQKFGESYPPVEEEGWIFFHIKKGSKPFLYFQPQVYLIDAYLSTNIGVYFQLFD